MRNTDMRNTENDGSKTTTQQSPLVNVEEKADLTLDGDLDIRDYVHNVKLDQKAKNASRRWLDMERETTRTRLAMTLVKLFGSSLVATFVLMGASAFSASADKAFIKDLIPLVITPQVTLLGVALGYYFGATDNEK